MPLPKKKSEKEKDYLKKIYLWYGQPKVGKTTTAANFGDDNNKILFFPTEPGHKFVEVFKWQTDKGEDPSSWVHFKQMAKELLTQEHDFKCIAVDTVDNLFKWCSRHVCKEHNIKHESELGFGRGYAHIRDEMHEVINAIGQKGYGFIFLSHDQSSDKTIGSRTISYIDTTMSGTAKKLFHGLCDYIFYFHADSEGHRLIRTKGTENINAGDRSGILKEIIKMDAETLIKELKQGDNNELVD